jgi:prepilin-type processing-associated H-X9-DG protein
VRIVAVALILEAAMSLGAQVSTVSARWPQHSMDRPQPRVVDPGPFRFSSPPPSDAVVLFDGKSLDGWTLAGDPGKPAGWKIVDGAMEVAARSGSIATKQSFGDVQLHLEWRAPSPPKGDGQERGNSGVFLMGRYEVQVLDSYHNVTYADGHAAAIYGQYPPIVNASRKPGEWQTYDIIFHRPRFDASGKVTAPARMTIVHNGVFVQDDAVLTGPTAHQQRPPYTSHADALPLALQDHGDPVRFRNIWVRKLE